MFKLALSIGIFVITSYIGFMYGETFRKRQNQLKEILKTLVLLKNDVLQCATPLTEALGNLDRKTDEPICSLINDTKNRLAEGDIDSIYDATSESYKNVRNEFNLEEYDLKLMRDFLRSLGNSGVYGQEALFNMTIEELKIHLEDANEAAKKNIKLYRYIGMCLGAMIVIFLL